MFQQAIRTAMRRVGSRAEVLGACPVCGGAVTPAHERVRAWRGTYAHRGCAQYRRRR
jgi:hypothetical protein